MNMRNSLFLFVLFLAGCQVRENKVVDPAFFSKPSSVLITEMTGLHTPSYTVEHTSGMGDPISSLVHGISNTIATSANAEATDRVNSMDVFPIVSQHYYQPFTQSFYDKNFTIKMLTTPILPTDLKAIPDGDFTKAPFDFSGLKSQFGADYALILFPQDVGIHRYPGVIFGKSISKAFIEFYLINLSDNTVVGYYRAKVEQEVTGNWDTPPYYELLLSSVETALKTAFAAGHTFLTTGVDISKKD